MSSAAPSATVSPGFLPSLLLFVTLTALSPSVIAQLKCNHLLICYATAPLRSYRRGKMERWFLIKSKSEQQACNRRAGNPAPGHDTSTRTLQTRQSRVLSTCSFFFCFTAMTNKPGKKFPGSKSGVDKSDELASLLNKSDLQWVWPEV